MVHMYLSTIHLTLVDLKMYGNKFSPRETTTLSEHPERLLYFIPPFAIRIKNVVQSELSTRRMMLTKHKEMLYTYFYRVKLNKCKSTCMHM